MISAQWHKVLNDLWGNKTRTLLIVLSIAVGLFATGTIVSTRTVVADQMAQGYADTVPSSGTLRTLEPFDDDFVRSVRAMKDVQAADARYSVTFRAQTKTGQWRTLRLWAIQDFDDLRVNKLWPQTGAWPPPERELLIERMTLSQLGAQVGDTLLIELPHKKQRELRIAGTAHDLSQFPARFANAVHGYVAFNTLEWLGLPYGANELHIVTASRDRALARSVLDQVETKAQKSGLTVVMTTVDKFPLEEMVGTVLVVLSILGLLSLCLSAFLIVNTISAMLAQQVRQIGVMKAIGAQTGQIMSMYLAMVVLYGLIALVVAVPLGIGGAYILSRLATDLLNFDLKRFDIPPQAIALQIAVGVIVPVLSSLYPFIAGLRVTAAEAMSSYSTGQSKYGSGPLTRLLSGANVWFAQRIPLRSLLLSVRDTLRSRSRLALTLTTLPLAGAIFISVFSVRDSLFHTIGDLMQWRAFDSMLNFARPYRATKVQQEAQRVPGVAQTDVWINVSAVRVRADKTESDTVFVFAPRNPSELMAQPVIVQGRWLEPEDQDAIVVSAYLLTREPDVKLGSDIVLKIDGQEWSWRVVGVCLDGAPPLAYINYPALARVTGNTGRASSVMVMTDQRDPRAAAQVTAALEQHYRDVGLRPDSVETTAEERDNQESAFGILIIGLLVMAVLFAVVGGLGLMGTMSINVIERTREIGVMRAIGAPTRSIAQVFIVESVAIGVTSWIVGTALAVPLSKIMSDAVGIPLMGTPITFRFSLVGVGLWLLVVVLLSVLASFIPARNAARLTVREVLAYE